MTLANNFKWYTDVNKVCTHMRTCICMHIGTTIPKPRNMLRTWRPINNKARHRRKGIRTGQTCVGRGRQECGAAGKGGKGSKREIIKGWDDPCYSTALTIFNARDGEVHVYVSCFCSWGGMLRYMCNGSAWSNCRCKIAHDEHMQKHCILETRLKLQPNLSKCNALSYDRINLNLTWLALQRSRSKPVHMMHHLIMYIHCFVAPCKEMTAILSISIPSICSIELIFV